MRRRGWFVAIATPVALAGWIALRARPQALTEGAASARSASVADAGAAGVTTPPDQDDGHEDERSFVFRMPSGEPTALSCEEARTIVEQVRAGLAYAPDSVDASALASGAADWLDPHGLLTLAKDAPTARAIQKVAPELIADLEGRRQRGCAAAMGPGTALASWVSDLQRAFDAGRAAPPDGDGRAAALDPLPPTGSARELATELGKRAGAFEAAYGPRARPFADTARKRFLPSLDAAGWSRVVLASAVRAYVPLVDPHGEWAPFDEESRIYEVDLASRPPARLWTRATPTAVGVRIAENPMAPLAEGDVVLAVGGVATAGLPLEQVDQLAFASSEAKAPLSAVVLRKGAIETLELGKPDEPASAGRPAAAGLPTERIAYADGDVLVLDIEDVKDDLGEELASRIAAEREAGPRKLVGVVLDLRGNGGGSTDGALGALSLFLPGAPLFAMKRRDGTVEVDRAPLARERDLWAGPVATLVDGTTASAAEMIAGALATYRRGPSVGTPTFGKGCAQEYVDDDAHAGVLRLTTLVYALPDGAPVQRVGLLPHVRFPFASTESGSQEREAKLAHAAPPWRGPDLREKGTPTREVAWPTSAGNVGPCREGDVCRALRALGASRRSAVAKAPR
jgi:carboxyl-terminal processing protease